MLSLCAGFVAVVVALRLMLPALARGRGRAAAANAFSREGLPVEYLDVYSTAMGRNIRRRVRRAPRRAGTGGPRPSTCSTACAPRTTTTAGTSTPPAFEWFYDSGVAVVMPVGGQSSFYTDWYSPSSFNNQAYTYKWETFLTSELPQWLAANKQVSTTGNGVVGPVDVGRCRADPVGLSPGAVQLRRVAVGLPQPVDARSCSRPSGSRCSTRAASTSTTCGARRGTRPGSATTRSSRWPASSANGTRLWIYCAPGGATPLDARRPGQAFNADQPRVDGDQQQQGLPAGLHQRRRPQRHLPVPARGQPRLAYWGAQLQALKPDLIATING